MIGIATAVYKRKDIFHIWAKNMLHCFPDAIVSVAYSEPYYKEIIEGHGFHAIYKDNFPLGSKFNAAVQFLRGKCDNIITTGSDDIVSDYLAEFYMGEMTADYVAFLDCYFYDTVSNRTKYWGGYTRKDRLNEPIGAGKMISARLMDEIQWTPFPPINKSLDYHFHQKLMNVKKEFWVSFNSLSTIEDAYLIDLKSPHNLNTFASIPGKEITNEWQKVTHYEASI